MNCSEIQNHLSAFLDGEIDASQAKAIQDHLAQCDACRQALDGLQAVVREVRILEPVPPPDDFLAQFHHRLDSRKAHTTWIKRLFRPLHVKLPLQLVTAMLVGGFIYYVVQTQQPCLITQPEKLDAVSRTAPIETQKSGKGADENLSMPLKDHQADIQEEKEEAARPMRKEALKRLLRENGVDSAAVRKKSPPPDNLELKRKILEERQVRALSPSEDQTGAPAPEAPKKDKSKQALEAKKREPAKRDTVIKLGEPIIYGPQEELPQKPAPAPKRQRRVIQLALVIDAPSHIGNKGDPRRSAPLVQEQERIKPQAEMRDRRTRGLTSTDSRETFEAEDPMMDETQAPPLDMIASQEKTRSLEPEIEDFRSPASETPKKRAIGQAPPQTTPEPEMGPTPAEKTPSRTALDQIIKLVKQVEGDVVDVSYSQADGLPCTITASIPKQGSRVFLKALNNVGQLTPPSKIIDTKEPPRITFRIRLLGNQAGLNCD